LKQRREGEQRNRRRKGRASHPSCGICSQEI